MRFLLVMLAVAASMVPLVACEATKAGEKDASASGNTLEAPGARHVDERRAEQSPSEAASEAARAEGTRPEALQATVSHSAEARALAADHGSATHAASGDTSSGDTATSDTATSDDIAAKNKLPPTSGDEGGIDEGNGEPMDDVDDEEVPATDKSGVDHPPAVDDEPEGTGIKLQE